MTPHDLHLFQDCAARLRNYRTKDPVAGQAADEAAERIEEVLARDQEREEVEAPF